MPRAYMFGKGVGLRVAITVTCQLSFILLGMDTQGIPKDYLFRCVLLFTQTIQQGFVD